MPCGARVALNGKANYTLTAAVYFTVRTLVYPTYLDVRLSGYDV